MGKIELLRNPVTRIFFKTSDITVDRKSKLSAFRAFKNADSLVKGGKSVVIFPEGKIDDEYPHRLHEFKSGAFKLALDNQVQILQVVIQNAWQILWDNGERFGSRPGTIRIHVLQPIDPQTVLAHHSYHIQTLVYDRMEQHWNTNNSSPRVKIKRQKNI